MGEDGAASTSTTVRLSVPSLTCQSCASSIEHALNDVAGTTEVDPDPTTGIVTVGIDPTKHSIADVRTAIENAGYPVAGILDESASEAEIADPMAVWTSERAINTGIGGVFLILGLLLQFILPTWNIVIASFGGIGLTGADISLLVAILVSGMPVVRSGYHSARHYQLDIDVLMGTAIIAATGIGFFIEAATLAVLFSTAELLERYAMDQTRDSLRELLELSPTEATVQRDDTEQTIPAAAVELGDRVLVRPGERIPVDGIVVEGESAIDQSPITGESVPVDKSAGDEVYAGTINEEGYLEFEATTRASETMLARIITLVRNAQSKQTDTEQFVDRFASYYTPLVVVLAILTATIPPLVLGWAWDTWFIRGLTLLVIACPCAFVISTPVSVASGITAAARNGVLIKGGNHLEALGEVNAIAFDKTGTLTKGELSVTEVISHGDTTTEEVLSYASGLEQRSEHPIGTAIVSMATDRGITPTSVSEFESITGEGISGHINGEQYFVGRQSLFTSSEQTDQGVTDGGTFAGPGTGIHDLQESIDALEHDGKTVVLVGTANRLLGIIGVADEIRPGAKRTITRLHELGIGPLVMLTGDNEGTARAVAEELGMDEYRARLLPDEKVDVIEELEASYGSVAMVGDGVNDAPALATATIGVAMGAVGTDTAIETADIALMTDDIETLPYLFALSRRANRVIRQNIWSSLAVKGLLAIGIPLGYVTVAIAVLVGDMGMSLGVTGNAMRLSRMKPETFRD